MLLWGLAARAATVCVGEQSGCLRSLQAALDDPTNDRIEIHGDQIGPFRVTHPVTLVGIDRPRLRLDSSARPLLWAEASLTLRDLILDGGHLERNLVAVGERVELEGVLAVRGVGPLGTRGCLVIQADELVVSESQVVGCWHFGAGAGLAAHVDVANLTDSTFLTNDGPALKVVGASSATLDGLSVRGNGASAHGWVGGVALNGVERLSLTRSWFCGNVGRRGGGLRIRGGCSSGDCRIEHAVFQSNRARAGGGLVWSGRGGAVAHSTFVANLAKTGLSVGVAAGHLDLGSSLIVEVPPDGPDRPPAALDTWLEGTLSLTGSALHTPRAGLPIGENLELPAPPAFFDGYVDPLCGSSAAIDPTAPDSAPFASWPDPSAIGAMTTEDCGPWCDDSDGDGVPAMWDCGPGDPQRGIGLEELGDDGIDQNCDGLDACYQDLDGDGYGSAPIPIALGEDCPGDIRAGGDCDEGDPEIHPGAVEIPGDRLDSDCDRRELCYLDGDQDGVTGGELIAGDLSCAEGPLSDRDEGDCDDADPERRLAYCAVRVVGGCSTTALPGGWLAALGWIFVRRRR